MFLARKTIALTTEGLFQRYVNSLKTVSWAFPLEGREARREGKVTENLHFTPQTWGWLGTVLVPGMPESRQNVLSTLNFLSFQPLPLTQPSEWQVAKSRWHKANYMRFIIWLSYSIGDCTCGFCRVHGKGRESKGRPEFSIRIKILNFALA